MPAAITHYLQAKRVLEELDFKECDRDAFLWGAQGPDFLFCHRYLPWQKGESLAEYGSKMHKESLSKLLLTMREYYQENKNPVLLSYIYGLICHYSADQICHPLVLFQAKQLLKSDLKQSEDIYHNLIESQLDIILLRYETGELPIEFSLKKTVPKNYMVQNSIAGLYSFVLKELYNKSISKEILLQATKDMRSIFGLLNDRTTLKKYILQRYEDMRGIRHTFSCHMRSISEDDEFDYANIFLQPWGTTEEKDKNHRESFLDLYELSITDAVRLIQGFLGAEDFSALIKEIAL